MIFKHWAAVTLKGLGEFQNKKILDILEIRGVFRTLGLRVLTVIDCPKIAGAKER